MPLQFFSYAIASLSFLLDNNAKDPPLASPTIGGSFVPSFPLYRRKAVFYILVLGKVYFLYL